MDLDSSLKSFNPELGTTNAILPDAQRHHAKALFSDFQNELKSIELDISKAQLHFTSLQDRHAQCLAQMRPLCIALSPPKYVPTDVLISIFLLSFDFVEIPAPRSRTLPPPWSLSHVYSSWRELVIGEPRLWRRIRFDGSKPTDSMLKEVLKRSGNLKLDFQASDLNYPKRGMVASIVTPLFKRMRHLSLNLAPKAMKHFLSLPSSSFIALEDVTLTTDAIEEMPAEDVHVFDNVNVLRRIALETDEAEAPPFPSFPLPLNLPWPQLTCINFKTLYVHVKVAHEVLNKCPSLREVHFFIDDNDEDGAIVEPNQLATLQTYPPSSIRLPDLRELALEQVKGLPTEFLQPLDCPQLEQFDFKFQEQSDVRSPGELATLLARSPTLERSELKFSRRLDIGTLAGDWPFITDIRASKSILSEPAMDLMIRGELLPKLRSISCTVERRHMDALLGVLRARWSKGIEAKVPNAAFGIKSAVIRVLDSDWIFKKEFLQKLRDVEEQLGVQDIVEVHLCHGPKASMHEEVTVDLESESESDNSDDD